VDRAAFALKPSGTSNIVESDGLLYILQTAGPNGFPPPAQPQNAAPGAPETPEVKPRRKPSSEPAPLPSLIEKEQGPTIPRPVQP
jgi:hypothetical protein